MLKKKILKEQKGILVSDAIIAILLILLFAGAITSLITNIYLESTLIKINSQQIDFATEIFEYIEKKPYAEVDQNEIKEYVNKKYLNYDLAEQDKMKNYVSAGNTVNDVETPEAAYRIGVEVKQYGEEESKLPIIKKIELTIETTLGKKKYSTEISTIKKADISEVKEAIDNAKSET